MARALAVALLVLLAPQGESAFPRSWRTVQDLVVDRPGPVRVPLPAETLDAARPGLEDLRVLGPDGKEVPWTLEPAERPPGPVLRPAQVRTLLHPESTEILIVTGSDAPVAAIDVGVASRDFIKAARVEESDDGRTWTGVREEELLFRTPEGSARTSLDLPPRPRAHLRVMLDDRRSLPVPVTGITIRGASPPAPQTEPLEVEMTERREMPGETRFLLRFTGRHARLAGVSVETPDPVFTRRVELSQATAERREVLSDSILYRKPFDGRPPAEQLSLLCNSILTGREAVLLVHNGDSPPLRVERIRARARPVRLTFAALDRGLFHVLAGNREATLPSYDVASLGEPAVARTVAAPGPIRVNPAWQPAEPLPGVPSSGALLDVSAWRFRKEVTLGPGDLHELELGPDILSAAEPSERDLRLVRDGRQVPYIRDDPPRLRTLEVSAAKTESRPGSTRSRWFLQLPHPRLPVRRISCDIEETFFRRSVLLVEESSEEGIRGSVVLGESVWSRIPGETSGRLEIELGAAPRSRRILLEIEDGDNPPLTPSAFRAHYAAPRILFKTSPGPGLFLYYGNRGVATPQYDLSMLSSALAMAERMPAAVGPEIPLKGSRASEDSADRWGTPVLWIVLGVLVLVLIAIIVRLFPHPDPS